jgi:PKD repeat protein
MGYGHFPAGNIMKFAQIVLALVAALFYPLETTAQSRLVSAAWEYPVIEGLAGFHLYQEETIACSTSDPLATSLNCTIDTADGETWFTIAAYFNDGTESAHSEPFTIIFSSGLKALFTSDTTEGESPLHITFDGGTSSGEIISYEWMFGDGESASGASVSHIFTAAGSYTVTLKVTDDTGAFDQENMAISVHSPPSDNTPPVAVLSSSSTTGRAPLGVQFDGGGSYDNDGTILSYSWELGDGGTAATSLVDYTYMFAGTFHSMLTVTDNGGLSDSISTPVLVQPPLSNNSPPTAVISASTPSGKPPVTVSFDGSGSSDPDGTVTSYSWNFGDGTSASGAKVRHRYTQEATYKVSLTVIDNMGSASVPATRNITIGKSGGDGIGPPPPPPVQVIINFLLLSAAETATDGPEDAAPVSPNQVETETELETETEQ